MKNTKSSLRTHFLGLLKSQGSTERQLKSQRIAEQLFVLPQFKKARAVLFYVSLPGEVDTFAMMNEALQLKKQVAVPVIVQNKKHMIPTLIDSINDLQVASYGIHEPKHDSSKEMALNAIDLVLVPGLAFDQAHNRLGRGAGYYDRFLASLPDQAYTVGLAFDFQVVDNRLPVEGHDHPLDHIIAA